MAKGDSESDTLYSSKMSFSLDTERDLSGLLHLPLFMNIATGDGEEEKGSPDSTFLPHF